MYNTRSEKDMSALKFLHAIMLLTCSHTIVADVIFDQIGPMDGSMVEGVFEPNQYFEPKLFVICFDEKHENET